MFFSTFYILYGYRKLIALGGVISYYIKGNFCYIDTGVSTCIVDSAILIKEKRRVNSCKGKLDGIGPSAVGVCGIYEEITSASATDICNNTVEYSFVVSNCRSIDTQTIGCTTYQFELIFSVKNMSDLLPVCQICDMVYWNSRKIFKTAVYKIEVIPNSAYAGIRMKSGYDRIMVFHGIVSFVLN